jgi:hypothetical protein
VEKIDLLSDSQRIKGMDIYCSDNKTELYGGSPQRNPNVIVSAACPEYGFSNVNIFELKDTSRIAGGISGAGFYCNNPNYDTLNPLYYTVSTYDPNSEEQIFQCNAGHKIIGFSGSYQDDVLKSLQIICDDHQNTLNPIESNEPTEPIETIEPGKTPIVYIREPNNWLGHLGSTSDPEWRIYHTWWFWVIVILLIILSIAAIAGFQKSQPPGPINDISKL